MSQTYTLPELVAVGQLLKDKPRFRSFVVEDTNFTVQVRSSFSDGYSALSLLLTAGLISQTATVTVEYDSLLSHPVVGALIGGYLTGQDLNQLRVTSKGGRELVATCPVQTTEEVTDLKRWRACFPHANSVRLASWRSLIPDEDFALLRGVQHVDLKARHESDTVLQYLTEVKHLEIASPNLSGDGFVHLKRLQILDIGVPVPSVFNINTLRHLPHLHTLNLYYKYPHASVPVPPHNYSDGTDLGGLRHLRNLKVLSVTSDYFTDETAAILPPSLEDLTIVEPRITDTAFQHFGHLKRLNFTERRPQGDWEGRVTNAAFRYLRSIRELTLEVTTYNMTSALFRYIPTVKKLSVVYLDLHDRDGIYLNGLESLSITQAIDSDSSDFTENFFRGLTLGSVTLINCHLKKKAVKEVATSIGSLVAIYWPSNDEPRLLSEDEEED